MVVGQGVPSKWNKNNNGNIIRINLLKFSKYACIAPLKRVAS